MATDIARAFFIGRLTRDIEVLFSGTGNLFGVINVAVHVYQGKNDPDRTSFFRITVPGRTVDAIGTYLTKGRQIAIDAVPVMTSWTDSGGTRKTRVQFDATNIQLLAGKDRNDGTHSEEHTAENELSGGMEKESASTDSETGVGDGFEDDMPF